MLKQNKRIKKILLRGYSQSWPPDVKIVKLIINLMEIVLVLFRTDTNKMKQGGGKKNDLY